MWGADKLNGRVQKRWECLKILQQTRKSYWTSWEEVKWLIIDKKKISREKGSWNKSRLDDKNTDLFFHFCSFQRFFLSFFLSLSLPLSLCLPLIPHSLLFHLSVREKSQQINFSFGRRSESARLSARILPSLIPSQITISLQPFIQYLFYHLSFSLSHAHAPNVRSEGFQRQMFFQNTTSLFSVIKSPDPIKTVLELRHSGVELSFFLESADLLKNPPAVDSLHAEKQDCEMLQWHETAPFIYEDICICNLTWVRMQKEISLCLIWDQY